MFRQFSKIDLIRAFFLSYIALYIILILLDLHLIPLVWFDEVMGLDPASNYIFGDGFKSRIWPQEGTETRYMAYLPLRFWLHIINLKLLPFNVYAIRLPWILYGLLSFYIFYRLLRAAGVNIVLSLIALVLLINDRVIFETLRSMRVEPVSYLVLMACFYFYFKKRKLLQAAFACILTLIHPNLWFIALAMFIDAVIYRGEAGLRFRKSDIPKFRLNLSWFFPLITLIFLLLYIDFDLQMFIRQLAEHGNYHSARDEIGLKFRDHFISRFWPYSLTQPWSALVVYAALVLAIVKLFRRQAKVIEFALIGTHVYWLLALAPFYRYNGILFVLSLILIIMEVNKFRLPIKWPISALAAMLFILISSVEVMGRHLIANVQRDERKPKPVIEWLSSECEEVTGNVLLFGHDIAFYVTANNKRLDYMLYNTYRIKFNYMDYEHCLFISDQPIDITGAVLQSEYRVKSDKYAAKSVEIANKPTYRHLYLYHLKSYDSFEKVLKSLKKENKSNVKVIWHI